MRPCKGRPIESSPSCCEWCQKPYPPVQESHGWKVMTHEQQSWRRDEPLRFFRLCPECAGGQ